MTFPGLLFTRASGFTALLTGFTTSTVIATDRYWDPLNDNSYLSTGYTTYTAAATVWNTTNAVFDISASNSTNAAWAAGG